MSSQVTNDGPTEIVLTAEQWYRLLDVGRAIERLRRRITDPEPDTGASNPPTWENL